VVVSHSAARAGIAGKSLRLRTGNTASLLPAAPLARCARATAATGARAARDAASYLCALATLSRASLTARIAPRCWRSALRAAIGAIACGIAHSRIMLAYRIYRVASCHLRWPCCRAAALRRCVSSNKHRRRLTRAVLPRGRRGAPRNRRWQTAARRKNGQRASNAGGVGSARLPEPWCVAAATSAVRARANRRHQQTNDGGRCGHRCAFERG